MGYETVTPPEARELQAESDVSFVDVRTPEEFEAGHIPGSINVPIAFAAAGGLRLNPDFVGVMRERFSPDRRLVFV